MATQTEGETSGETSGTYALLDPQLAAFDARAAAFDAATTKGDAAAATTTVECGTSLGTGDDPPASPQHLTSHDLARRLLGEPVLAILPAFLLFALVPVDVPDADLVRSSFPVADLLRAHGWFFLVFNPLCCLLGWVWLNTLLCEYVGNRQHVFDGWVFAIAYAAIAVTGLAVGFVAYGNLFAIAVLLIATFPRVYTRLPAAMRGDPKAMGRFRRFWAVFAIGCGVVLLCSFYMVGMMWVTSAAGPHAMWVQLALAVSFRVANKLARVWIAHVYRDDPLMVVLVGVLWAEQCVTLYLYLSYPAIDHWYLSFTLLGLQTLLNTAQYWLIGDAGMAWRTAWRLPYTFPAACVTAAERADHYRKEVSHRHFLSLWIQAIACVFFLVLTLALRYGMSRGATMFGCFSAYQYGTAVAFIASTVVCVCADAAVWVGYVRRRYAIDAVRELVWDLAQRPLTAFTTSLVVAVLPIMILFKPYNAVNMACMPAH